MKIIFSLFLFSVILSSFAQTKDINVDAEPFSGLLLIDSVKLENYRVYATNNGPNFIQIDSLNGVFFARIQQTLYVLEGAIQDLKTENQTDAITTRFVLSGTQKYKGERVNFEINDYSHGFYTVKYFKLTSGIAFILYAHLATQEEEQYIRKYFQ